MRIQNISMLVALNTFGNVLGDVNNARLDVAVSIQDTLRLFLFGFLVYHLAKNANALYIHFLGQQCRRQHRYRRYIPFGFQNIFEFYKSGCKILSVKLNLRISDLKHSIYSNIDRNISTNTFAK